MIHNPSMRLGPKMNETPSTRRQVLYHLANVRGIVV